MLASTRLDIVPNVDTHIMLVPSPTGVIPTPVPLPFAGLVFGLAETALSLVPDAAELLATVADAVTGAESSDEHGAVGAGIVAAADAAFQLGRWVLDPVGTMISHARGTEDCGRVKINGLWATKAGDPVTNLAIHQMVAPLPLMPFPSDSADLSFGALMVFFENHAPVRLLELAESCAFPMDQPTAVIALPKGSPVLILRPPAPDLASMVASAVGNVAGTVARRLARTRWVRGLRAGAKRLAGRVLGAGRARAVFRRAICRLTGEPVDVATGRVLSRYEELSLPGPIPLTIERHYDSSLSWRDGPLGHGWHLSLDQRVWQEPGRVVVRMDDGRELELDTRDRRGQVLEVGGSLTDPVDRFTVARTAVDLYEVRDGDIVREHRVLAGGEHAMLVRIRDPQSFHAIELSYDRDRRLERVRDSCGRVVRFVHDRRGRLVALEAPIPHGRGWVVHRRYEVDAAGDLVRVTDACGASFVCAYESHLKVRKQDRAGLTWFYEYDGVSAGARCTRTWGSGPAEQQTGLLHRVLHYLSGRTVVEDGLGHPTVYVLDEAGLVVEEIDALGGKTLTERDPETAALLASTDAMGRVTRVEYDTAGRVVGVARPDGGRARVGYDSDGRAVSVVDATGAEWRQRHSHLGDPIDSVDPAGAVRRMEWTEHLLTAEHDELGRVVRFHHESGMLVRVTLPNGGEHRITYDGRGRVVKERDARGGVRELRYDAEGRVVEERSLAGVTHRLAYDAEGNCVAWSDGERSTTTRYGSWHLPVWQEESGAITRMEHDVETRLVAVLNEHDERSSFRLDACGRLVEETDFAGRAQRYVLDASGAVVERVTALGSTKVEYDAGGRPVRLAGPSGASTACAYDAEGRVVSLDGEQGEVRLERDLVGRVVREWQRDAESADWHWVELTLDATGAVQRLATSAGASQSIERDELGAPRRSRCGSVDVSFDRDLEGLERERRIGSLRVGFARDAAGRLVERTTPSSTRRLEWRAEHRLEAIADSVTGVTRYQHDARGRVVGAQHTERREVRALDAVGNVFRTPSGADRRYAAGGVLEEGDGVRYEHDAEGRRTAKILGDGSTWRYRWDGNGRLAEVERPDGVVVRHRYDALARRIRKTVVDGERVVRDVRFVWHGAQLLHELRDEGGESETTTWYPVPDSDQPMVRERGGRAAALVNDHLGTPNELHDLGDGADVARLAWRMQLDLHGVAHVDVGDTHDCPFRWPGQYEDEETGLYQNRFRYYDPDTARYISPDPIGLAGGWAAYAYVDDVLAWIDPEGLNKASGDIGERYARGYVRSRGHRIIGSIANNSGHGIDIVSSDGNGRLHFWEIKRNGARLSPAQRDPATFIMSRLEAASTADLAWEHTPNPHVDLLADRIITRVNAETSATGLTGIEAILADSNVRCHVLRIRDGHDDPRRRVRESRWC